MFLQKTLGGEAALGFGELLGWPAFGGCGSGGMTGAFVFDFDPSAIAGICDLPQQCFAENDGGSCLGFLRSRETVGGMLLKPKNGFIVK